jgi:hypothetical protein
MKGENTSLFKNLVHDNTKFFLGYARGLNDSFFDSREGKVVFLFCIEYIPALGSTHPPIQRVSDFPWG